MERIRLAVAACGMLVGASTLHAQQFGSSDNSRLIRFGFGGGVIVPRTGATVESLKTGMQGQGFVLLQLPGGLPAIRANVDYAKMKFDSPTTAGGGTATPTGNRTVLDGVAGLKFDLIPGPVRPYITAGLGAFNVTDLVGATSTSNLNYGVDGGAGIALKLGPIDAFIETRLQNVWTKKSGLVDAKSIQSFPVTFGILF